MLQIFVTGTYILRNDSLIWFLFEYNQQVRVNVLNGNDNRPLLEQLEYTVKIYENTTVNTEILRVQATDLDQGDRLAYSLDSAACESSLSKFTVQSKTGAITTLEPLDHEMQRVHILTVQVKDHSFVNHRNYTQVIINIMDSNDHAPEFGSNEYKGNVFETATVGTRVSEVYAYDRDQGTNAQITYSIVSGENQLNKINVAFLPNPS